MSVNDKSFTKKLRQAVRYFNDTVGNQEAKGEMIEIKSEAMETLGYAVSILTFGGTDGVKDIANYMTSKGIGISSSSIGGALENLESHIMGARVMLEEFAMKKGKNKFANNELSDARQTCYVLSKCISLLDKENKTK